MSEENKKRTTLILEKAFLFLGFPFRGSAVHFLGFYQVTKEVIDRAEDAGFFHQPGFNKVQEFFWHPVGEEILVQENESLPLYCTLTPGLQGVFCVLTVGEPTEQTSDANKILAKIIFDESQKRCGGTTYLHDYFMGAETIKYSDLKIDSSSLFGV